MWGTALLYRRSCPEGARVWKFVQWSPTNGCPSDQARCCRFGKRALTTGAQIVGDVVAGKNTKKAEKRMATAAGRNLMQSLLNTPPPPGKRVKRIKHTSSPCHSHQTTTANRRVFVIWRSYTDNRVRE